jgi:negative regulator of sigma E activity
MDDRLRLIQSLYDDAEPPADLRRRLADDEALRREYEALQEAKAALDRRPLRSPDAEVVDRVVARAEAAAGQAAPDTRSRPARSRAADRPARGPSPEWTHRLQGVSAAVAVVLLAGIGWWAVSGGLEENGSASTVATESTTQPSQVEAARGNEQAIPAWDDRDELVRIHSRIERLQSQEQMGAWSGQPQPVPSTP